MDISVKTLLGLLLVAFGVGVFAPSYLDANPTGLLTGMVPLPTSSFSGIQPAFCPSPTCVSLVVSAIDNARVRVWVAMYSFTNKDLRDALIRAKNRGVEVNVLFEKQQAGSQYSVHPELVAAGISVKIDSNPQLMHDKFAVLDSGVVVTGSMNWTQNGVSENNENVIVIHSSELNGKYAQEFEKIWGEGNGPNN